jgi:hypothetical protein
MMRKYIFVFGALIGVLNLPAQVNDSVMIKKIADDIMLNGKAYDNLYYLCKKIGARLSGSANAQKAVEATARMLKEAGADTVYLQPCMVPHWIRGAKETGYVQSANGKKYNLKLCALGNSVGTGAQGIAAPLVQVQSFDELDRLGAAGVKGKIVFFNMPMNPTYFETFRAYGESGRSRVFGPAKAAQYGAVAVMVRSLASNVDDYPHTGVTVYTDTFSKIPAVAISTNNAEWISSQLNKKIAFTAYLQTNCAMLPDVLSYNVVGEIRGSQLPHAYITVGGHLDSWDLGEGAHDDGAGCVQSIEVIRAIKASGLVPRHTIRAVMFMNEENGGRGGDKYLELALAGKEKHVFAIESDEGGFTPRGFTITASDSQVARLQQYTSLLSNYGTSFIKKGGSGADINELDKAGAVLAGFSPDPQRYFDVHHAAADVFEAVSKRELQLGAVNMTALIYLVDKYGL